MPKNINKTRKTETNFDLTFKNIELNLKILNYLNKI